MFRYSYKVHYIGLNMQYTEHNKTKEVKTMHAVTRNRTRTAPAYPNAADRQYYVEKLVDSILSAAICVGIITILFFLITML